MAVVLDEQVGDEKRSRRGRKVALLAAGAVVLLVGAFVVFEVREARLRFSYEVVSGPVRPGEEVTVRAPGETCGPLMVSLHEEGILGFWSQTHSGDIISGFAPDERSWWRLSRGPYMTPLPCGPEGTTSFVVPRDVTAETIAACDMDGKCARISIDPRGGA